MKEGIFKANIVCYTLAHKAPKAPYVLVTFEFEDGGRLNQIRYIGSLSEAAREYTLSNLKSIGYEGELRSWDEIQSFIKGEAAGVKTEDITISIAEEVYLKKKRYRVKWFNAGTQALSEDEQYDLAKQIFEYQNVGAQPESRPESKPAPKPAAKAQPKPAPKPKPQQQLSEAFEEDEEIPF